MSTTESRAIRAIEEVLAIEHAGTGQVTVYTWSGTGYFVDVTDRICECPDYRDNLGGRGWCKHIVAALVATEQLDVDIPPHREVVADVSDRNAERKTALEA